MVKIEPLSEGKKLFYFVSGIFETFITVGIIFGWTPLLTILISEGQYDELCPGGQGPCDKQSLKLNLIFTITVSLFGATFLPAGLFLDKVGPRASRLVGSAIFTAGLILFGASDSKKFDAFIPAYLMIGLGCPPIFSSFFQWSSLFSRSELFITMLNCAFDGGAIVFFIFEMLYKAGIKRSYIFYGYSIFGVFIFIHSAIMKDPIKQEKGKRMRRHAVEYFTDIKKAGWGMPKKQDDFYTFKEQLKSIYYIMPTICLVVVATMINYYVGTVSEQLKRFHPSTSTLNTIQTLFNLVFPLGTVVWVVPISWMLSKFSMITSLFFALSVGIAFGAVTCVSNLYAQFAAFVLLSLFRPLIYSTLSTYITVVFGFRRFGSLYGIMNVVNGVFGLGIYFLNYLVFSVFGGDFFRVNLGLTCMIALMYAFPVFLRIRKSVHDKTGDNTYLRVQGKIEQEISRLSLTSSNDSTRSTTDSSRLDLQTLSAAFAEYDRAIALPSSYSKRIGLNSDDNDRPAANQFDEEGQSTSNSQSTNTATTENADSGNPFRNDERDNPSRVVFANASKTASNKNEATSPLLRAEGGEEDDDDELDI